MLNRGSRSNWIARKQELAKYVFISLTIEYDRDMGIPSNYTRVAMVIAFAY